MGGRLDRDQTETGHRPDSSEEETSLLNGSPYISAAAQFPAEGIPGPPADFPAGSRFRDAQFLGAGGMGWVYRVFDPQVERWIAVKLLHSHDPESKVRFTLEARALAQLDHPHIVKLLEVGEIAGIPFLSMPVLDGTTLLGHVESMSLAGKVRLLGQVAEAVHSAHQRGILHRDLKPTNVMVVANPDGSCHPYVMDFGLALVADSPVLTRIGQVMGTVLYMSPEQASGDRMSLDVRSDVYSLGMTAYHFLCGQPPFKGDSSLTLLRKVLTEDPPNLRELAPTIPEDLARVVHKAIEKQPSRRYESARDFAEDLRRYGEGRPVLAQPPSAAYRASKWVSRHRLAANTLAVSLASLLLMGGWAAWAIRRANLRGTYAFEAKSRADAIVHDLRLAWAAPAHLVRPHLQKANSALQELGRLQQERGALFQGPAALARGRIFLELGRLGPARAELQSAWDYGARGPEVAVTLGEALNLLYYQKRHELKQDGVTPAALERLDRELRRPAQKMLAMGNSPSGEKFATASAMDLDGRHEEALALLETLLAESPWRSDLALRQVLCWKSIAWRRTTAADPIGAQQAWSEAGRAMDRALDLARSNPRLHEERLQLLMDIAHHEADHGIRDSYAQPRIKKALEAGLKINPESTVLLLLQAEQLYRQALTEYEAGQPGRELLEQAIQSAGRAVAVDPGAYKILTCLGRYLLTRLEWDFQAGSDTGPDLLRAQEALGTALKLQPDRNDSRKLLMYVQYMHGQILARQGQDPRPAYRQALATARLAARADLDSLNLQGAVLSLVNTLLEADLALGSDPERGLAEGAQAGTLALKGMPDYPNLLTDLGRLDRFAATWDLARARDPSPALSMAEAHLRAALAKEPRFREAYQELGELGLLRARAAQKEGRGDQASLEAAARAFGAASRLAPEQVDPLLGIAEAGALSQGAAGAALRRQGAVALQEVMLKQPDLPRCRALQGALILAGLDQLPPKERLKQARKAQALLDQALAKDQLLRVRFAPWRDEAGRAAR